MDFIDVIGFLAGMFVVLTFHSTKPFPLRGFAVTSNVLFVIYAIERDLLPIATLHLVLLPLNFWRLRQAVEESRGARRLA